MAKVTPITPNRSDALTALRTFLITVLPDGVDAIIAVENRVPEPSAPDFCIMTPIRFQRLMTNVGEYQDCAFTASIAPAPTTFTASIIPVPGVNGAPSDGGKMIVTAVAVGTLYPGALLSGPKVKTGTRIVSQIDGSAGGIGSYKVSISQATPATTIDQASGLMTVTALDPDFGPILKDATVFGIDLLDDTTVLAFGTGTGAAGTYVVSRSQTVASEKMSAGGRTVMMSSRLVVQVDFHSLNNLSADMAQTVAMLFRDQVAVSIFAGLTAPLNNVAPFYADDPAQRPFQNENQQYEWRWIVEAHMQMNQTCRVAQQFADQITVTLEDVTATIPA